MRKITYTDHILFRLNQRNIPRELPKLILENAEEFYYDKKTNYYVAVSKVEYKGKKREMIVIFEINDEVDLITIHPIKNEQKKRRVKLGRWVRMGVKL